ncbi:NADH-quinone oxidoreductase subunit A [Buchnera aphidicola (Ceratovacuna keduensis)]|uniref:NADH-quinone oxidoreductase subunit A n=1 Tax=Buchnera aphidicola TaxID=9 RepID=UPI0031B8A5A2
MKDYSILIYFISSIIFCLIILLISNFLGTKRESKNKNLPFESGIYSYGNYNSSFFVQFYLIVLFFVIFDTESLYLYTWSISVRETSWLGFFESLFFVFTLSISFFYIIRLNIFDFNKKS